MLQILAVLGVIGVVGFAAKLIAESAEEHERHRKKAAELEREAVKWAAEEERVELQADAEHKEWARARDHIRKQIEAAKAYRRSLYSNLAKLKKEKWKFGVRLNDANISRKREIWEALYMYDEALDRQYADARICGKPLSKNCICSRRISAGRPQIPPRLSRLHVVSLLSRHWSQKMYR